MSVTSKRVVVVVLLVVGLIVAGIVYGYMQVNKYEPPTCIRPVIPKEECNDWNEELEKCMDTTFCDVI